MDAKKNLWTEKKKKIVLLIAAVMVLVFAVSFVSYFRVEEEKKEEEFKPYESMYNASRYFFRVFYPDNWDVSAEPYGFLLDEKGLVLELFPLKKMSNTPGVTGELTPTPSPTPENMASATVDPRAGLERDTSLTVKIYYKEYGDIAEKIQSNSEAVSTSLPTEVPTATVAPTATETPVQTQTAKPTPPVELLDLADYIFDEYKKEHEVLNYEYIAPKRFDGASVEFCSLPYTYVKDDLKMMGEIYVANRAMAYYVITVEGTKAAFETNNKVVSNIIHNLKFSVFDY